MNLGFTAVNVCVMWGPVIIIPFYSYVYVDESPLISTEHTCMTWCALSNLDVACKTEGYEALLVFVEKAEGEGGDSVI